MTDVRVDFPGLLIERMASGALRYRVRMEGDKTKRTRIPVGPDHPDFGNLYWAARGGVAAKLQEPPKPTNRSLAWLTTRYLTHLTAVVAANGASASTLRQRQSLLKRLCDMTDADGDLYGSLDMDLPTTFFVTARNKWLAKSAEADNLIKAARAMYRWACDTGLIEVNPTIGVANIHRSQGGATPWTAQDLKAFRATHPPGTTAYLWLTLTMFTACRIGDAIWLGRGSEIDIAGMTWLRFQPRKRGSALVEIPVMPPLYRATRDAKVQGAAYLLTKHGRPFTSDKSLGNQVRIWCDDAGLPDRSAHGVRKAMAELLAESGCTQHQIMAVMAHTQAKTSEVYTKGAQRRILASDAVKSLAGFEW